MASSIIHEKSVVGTRRAAFHNIEKGEIRHSPSRIGDSPSRVRKFPSSRHRLTHRVAIGNPDGWSIHTSLPPSHHRSTNRVAIGIHDGYLNYKIFARKLDFAFLRLYLCSVSPNAARSVLLALQNHPSHKAETQHAASLQHKS